MHQHLQKVLDYKSCPMWSSNHVSYTAMQTYDYKNISVFWDVTPRSQAGMYQHFRHTPSTKAAGPS